MVGAVVLTFVEGVVDDGQVVFVEAVEAGDAGVEFADEFGLGRFVVGRPDRHSHRGGPLGEPVVDGGQPSGDLDGAAGCGIVVDVGVGDGEVVEDAGVEVQLHHPSGVPVENHRREHPDQEGLVPLGAPDPQQVGGLVGDHQLAGHQRSDHRSGVGAVGGVADGDPGAEAGQRVWVFDPGRGHLREGRPPVPVAVAALSLERGGHRFRVSRRRVLPGVGVPQIERLARVHRPKVAAGPHRPRPGVSDEEDLVLARVELPDETGLPSGLIPRRNRLRSVVALSS